MNAIPLPDKATLRKQLRAKRLAVPAPLRVRAGRQVERLALHGRWLAAGRRVGFYIPAKGEIDILPLLNRALWMGVQCYLPAVPPKLGAWHGPKRLWFTRLGEAAHPWTTNRYGIPEYRAHQGRLRARQLDVLFLPMLGFDAEGYRMGMGGGYYDATLAYLPKRHHWKKPRLVGIAFDVQRLERVPRDPWDVPLDAVITERKVYRRVGPA